MPFVSEPLESLPKLLVFFFRPRIATWKRALCQRPSRSHSYTASLRMEGSTASLYRLAHWSSVRPGSSFATSYQRFPCLLTASKRTASSPVVQRPSIRRKSQVRKRDAVINTFAKLRIKGMNPALPTGFVVPTYTSPINMRRRSRGDD